MLSLRTLFDVARTQVDPDFVAMMHAKDVPLVSSQAQADELREWLRRPSPTRRPLPIEEWKERHG